MNPHLTRRRPLAALSAAGIALLALAGCSSSGASGDSQVGIGYFESATIGPEVLVAGNNDLAGKVGAKIKLTPIDSGVAGLAELRGGAFPFVSGVGNPPVVGAISSGTKLKVIYAEYFDAAQLIVPSDIKSNADLAGKTIGDLEGSSEDFEIRGWLTKEGLASKVKVVGFPSEQAVAAAFKAKRIGAGYVEIAQAQDLIKNSGGRKVVTAQQIANLGYPSLNVLAVTDSYASAHRSTVQNLVCQVMRAQTISTGPKADSYISKASKLVGSPASQAIPATKAIPFVSAKDELSWFESSNGSVADGRMAKSYALTGQFLKTQGRVKSVPSSSQIAAGIDPSYVKKAIADGCGK